ncbi:hypothetical protein IHE44_0000506 [Lamprotornis superbus]|uniref:Uncharacterized protein n=1 Tax=Lamprotornis superbus TaxID=245042 RepID=A0A835NS69_9PASS|nr:hypothetical protein IHE44_0000506 [Lamprotornis superbus]
MRPQVLVRDRPKFPSFLPHDLLKKTPRTPTLVGFGQWFSGLIEVAVIQAIQAAGLGVAPEKGQQQALWHYVLKKTKENIMTQWNLMEPKLYFDKVGPNRRQVRLGHC